VPFNQLRMRQADGSLIAEVPTPRTGGAALPATMGALRSDLQNFRSLKRRLSPSLSFANNTPTKFATHPRL